MMGLSSVLGRLQERLVSDGETLVWEVQEHGLTTCRSFKKSEGLTQHGQPREMHPRREQPKTEN